MTLQDSRTGTRLDPLVRDALRPRVERVLTDFLAEQAEVLAEVDADLAPLVEAARALLRGGKRLRPAFCYWGFRGTGAGDEDGAVAAAAALELFHLAALVHDDIMDSSDTRHGQPSGHRRFAALHGAAGLDGDADRFGTAAAILLGDLCLTWSDELLSRCGLDPAAVLRGRRVYDVMRSQLMGGQYLELLEQGRRTTSVDRVRTVVTYKSAKYTVEHPLLLGGSLADGGAAVLAAYSAYGVPLGEAFQLRDDVLGVFGDPGRTGKPAGDDLREGKRTLLVTYALAAADPGQSAALRRLGAADLDPAELDRMRQVIVDTGALGAVEARIVALTSEALHALEGGAVDDGAADVLADLAVAATRRET